MSDYLTPEMRERFEWNPDDTLRTRIDKLIGFAKLYGNHTGQYEAALDMLCDPDRDIAGGYDRPTIVECYRGRAHFYDSEVMASMREHCLEIADKIEKRERLT